MIMLLVSMDEIASIALLRTARAAQVESVCMQLYALGFNGDEGANFALACLYRCMNIKPDNESVRLISRHFYQTDDQDTS